ncbi:MAG TPA: hypothetical protein VHM19_07795, partial [Polyangiales bacterium]|nr:hypothetical protein [Polyangiales bacterium]
MKLAGDRHGAGSMRPVLPVVPSAVLPSLATSPSLTVHECILREMHSGPLRQLAAQPCAQAQLEASHARQWQRSRAGSVGAQHFDPAAGQAFAFSQRDEL